MSTISLLLHGVIVFVLLKSNNAESNSLTRVPEIQLPIMLYRLPKFSERYTTQTDTNLNEIHKSRRGLYMGLNVGRVTVHHIIR